MSAAPSVHASCVVVGEAGVLVRGASGAGKSSFSAALIASATSAGRFARLVADDRVLLGTAYGRLLARVPVAIAGLIERRGVGIERVPFVSAAVIRLVVDLVASVERMPEEAEFIAEIAGVSLARLPMPHGAPDGPSLALARLARMRRERDCVSSALAFGDQDGKITDTMAKPSNSRSGRARAARADPRSERNEFCAETQ